MATLKGTNGSEYLGGTQKNDKLYGKAGDDSVYGESGNDKLYGDEGDDFLNGKDGKDKLYGGDGNDYLYGQAGNDTLTGGAGADTFEIYSPREGIDTITDFSYQEGDKIRIDSYEFGASSTSQFMYDYDTGALYYEQKQIASLQPGLGFDPKYDITLYV